MFPLLSRCLPVFLVAFSLLAERSSHGEEASKGPHELIVGGRTLKIPAPQGFVRCDGVNSEWDRAITSILPASNRMLATFGSAEDREKIRAGTPSDYQRNFNIQSVRSIESMEIGERTFAGMRDEVQKEILAMRSKLDAEMKRITDQGNKKISADYGVDVALSISDTAVLGFFEETDISIGFTMAMNVAVTSDGEQKKSKGIVACLMTPVNGRLVNLYSSAAYDNEADRKEVESTVKAWRDGILAVNPKVQGPVSGLGSLDFKNLAIYCGVGVGVGLIYALVLWLNRKPKQSNLG